jgi:hypothetical protein
MRPHPRLGPQDGKTPPSAGPELSCWREAFQEGRLRFDTARSLASGYSFVGAHAGAGVLPVLTGNRGQPVATLDPAAQIEPAISSRGRPHRVKLIA